MWSKDSCNIPDAVTVTPVERAGMTIYELRLDPQDVGKIIGRQGMTINAIRSLLLAGSAKKGLALLGGNCRRQAGESLTVRSRTIRR